MGGCLKVIGYISAGIIGLAVLAAIVSEFIGTSEGEMKVVNTPVLNVRKGPGADLEKVGEKRYGDTIKVVKDSAGWSQFISMEADKDTSLAWVKKTYIADPSEVEKVGKDEQETKSASKSQNNDAKAASYEIVKTEDLSSKNYGKLSPEYDLSKAPKKRKIQYHIALGLDITREQIEPTTNAIIRDITEKNPELDEAILELYSEKGLAKGGASGDVASSTWAPNGELGNVTPEIARSNDRSKYDIKIEQKQENLSEYLNQKEKTEKKFGLTEDKRKEIYKAIIKAGDRAIDEADKKYSVGSRKHSKATDRLAKKYKSRVYDEYGITKSQADKIINEALEENWATP
jgi:hypothetical protein